VSARRYLRLEPNVELGDYRLGASTWEELDVLATSAVGVPALAVPSLRVGICWTLEYLGLRRHADHILIPRFVGRCILNTINRAALPVEAWTPQTRAMLVVHQFGLRQHLEEVQAESAARAIPYLEDAPFGFEPREQPGMGALVKFLGISKVLPVLKGAIAVTGDDRLATFLRTKRRQSSAWSWPLLGALALLRRSRFAASHSTAAELAYELYPESRGDNAVFRGNVRAGLERIGTWERAVGERLAHVRSALGDRVAIPDARRLASIVPYFVPDTDTVARAVFESHGFDPATYHVDVNRRLLAPEYRTACLIPVHPRIPRDTFERLVDDLRRLS
jgi:hypothetical protein